MGTVTKITVATRSHAVIAMESAVNMTRALLDGTDCMRAAAETYMPKWPNEEPASYSARLKISTLFPAFKRTVETLSARPFSKPVTINDDVPPEIKKFCKNFDLQGRNIDQVGYDLMVMAMGPGFGGILVEHQVKPEDVKTKADEIAAGLRPYVVVIRPEQILGWRHETKDGEAKLTMLRFMEIIEEPDGLWLTKDIEQVRVLEPGKWATYRKNDKGEWNDLPHEEGATTLDDIPFTPIYGERLGFMCAKPPLLELGHLNVKHWQSQSDQDVILHVARVPILTVIGVVDSAEKPFELTIGASAAVKLPQDATMEYVEHTGAAIDAGKTSLDDLKEEMRQSGAEMLVMKHGNKAGGPATATEVASDNAVGMCALQRIALMLQDALDSTLQFMADYIKKDTGGTIKLFMDFAAATLAEASASMLISLTNSGGLSHETLISELKRRGLLAADVTWEDEMAKMEVEAPLMLELHPPPPAPVPGNKPAVPAPPGPPKPPVPPVKKPVAVPA